MSEKYSYVLWPAALMLALALTGCGDGGGDSGNASNTGAGNNTGGQSIDSDSFLSRVNSLIGNDSDTAEPEPTESITVTNPENTEPASIS